MKPKILMLGWEFPPIVSGGLGQATLGLCQALSKLTEVIVVVPKAEEKHLSPPSQVVSLANYSTDSFSEYVSTPFTDLMASQIQSVSPYSPYASEVLVSIEKVLEEVKLTKTGLIEDGKSILTQLEETVATLHVEEAYGKSLLQQIVLYSKLAVNQALQYDFDIIHAHDWITFIAAIELKKITGKPLVCHIHSLEYDRVGPGSKGWVYELEKYAMELADLIIPVSHYTGNIISYRYGIDGTKVLPIHNGVEAITPYKKERGFDDKLITFVGRMVSQKGPQIFLRLARELLKNNKNLRFAIAGEGDMKRSLMEEVARFRLGDHIHFTGFLQREEIYDLLAISDIVVMPSRSEPFGLVALEAATFGVPVIVSQYSGVIEVLKHAPKIEPSEVLQIKGYITRLLKDEGYYQRLVQSLQEDARGLTWEAAAQKIMESYARVWG